MYESSGSQFFRTTTEIQSGPDAFLTNLRVTEILCSFRLVVEGKTGEAITGVIKIRVLRKVFTKVLLYQMQKTIPPGC